MELLLSILVGYLLVMFVALPLVGVVVGAVLELCAPFVRLYRWVAR